MDKSVLKGTGLACSDVYSRNFDVYISLTEQCSNPLLDDSELEVTPYQPFYNEGDSISFSCPNGFELIGPDEALCEEGEFNLTPEPSCEGMLYNTFYTALCEESIFLVLFPLNSSTKPIS